MRTLRHLLICLFCLSSASLAFADDTYVTVLSPYCSMVSHGTPQGTHLSCATYHQTTGYTCGPAAVMMLMHYYHMLGNRDLNGKTEMRIAQEMGATQENEGSSSSQMEDWLSIHGMQVDSGNGVDTDFLINNLKDGKPVIVGYNRHWLLAKGFNKGSKPEEDQIIFADSCCNVSVMSRETLDNMQQEARMPENHCAGNVGQYIVATPKGH